MKIRQSHVTNSSSSSFIVAFVKGLPKTKEELQKLLFGKSEKLDWCGHVVSTDYAAEIIFRDLKSQKPRILSEKSIRAELMEGSGDWSLNPREARFMDQSGRTNWDAYFAACNNEDEKLSKEYAKSWIKSLPQDCKEWYLFEYCDEDGGVGMILENENPFYKLPHIKVNKH